MRITYPSVVFDTLDGFLAELDADATEGLIDRGIVRLTCQQVTNYGRANWDKSAIHLEVGYRVVAGGVVRYARTWLPFLAETEKAQQEASEVQGRVQRAAQVHRLNVRDGVFQAAVDEGTPRTPKS